MNTRIQIYMYTTTPFSYVRRFRQILPPPPWVSDEEDTSRSSGGRRDGHAERLYIQAPPNTCTGRVPGPDDRLRPIHLQQATRGPHRHPRGGESGKRNETAVARLLHDEQPARYDPRIKAGKVRLPKVGFVRFTQHRPFEGVIRSATVSMTKTGKFFVSLLVKQDDEPWIPAENKVGIDLGLKHFAVMTNDAMVSEKIDNPRFLRKSEAKVKKAQRALSRKKIGSKNREKATLLLAKKHEKIANQRKDFLHKLSRRIVDENQVIVVETLTSKDMMKNHKVAKSIGDVSWHEFVRQLEYKCKFYGRTLIKAGQWFASTQICSSCGVKGEKKTVDDREWTCTCGAHHDRDINASINLLMLAD